MNKNIEILINDIKKIIGDRFLSAVLYGSYADNTQSKTSDINLIVVIEQLTALDLKNLHPAVKKWKNTPLFMGKTEWFASSDVYPMEYADIKDRHSILYGDDIVSGLKIDKCHLRLQCESETKNLLIRLRQGYVANSSDKKAINELILNSSKSLMAIFKTILRLTSDEKVPNDKSQVINKVSSLIGFDAKFFNSKNNNLIIQKLIDSIYDVLKYVDKLETCNKNTCKEV
ncbi:MAG: hypothetical protein A2Y25_11580 [Candidatus Melainabacteria bacterium GWF2_37_15]|nr:MAG: hypothetical protein A2Y25_11580 [Candidatus Melainabacteria bacterium GWF2_37_15]